MESQSKQRTSAEAENSEPEPKRIHESDVEDADLDNEALLLQVMQDVEEMAVGMEVEPPPVAVVNQRLLTNEELDSLMETDLSQWFQVMMNLLIHYD